MENLDPDFATSQAAEPRVRARMERSASGKLVKMLTADDLATEQDIDECTTRIVQGFFAFERKVEEAEAQPAE